MSSPRRIVIFVEGDSDEAATPALVGRILSDWGVWEAFVDNHPFVVGNVEDVTRNNGEAWIKYLNAAARRPNLGAVLLLLDGDIDPVGKEKESFCAARFAARLASWSGAAGGGRLFSVACVFARQEYESWVLACLASLAGLRLADGRPGVKAGSVPPSGDLEIAPRNAKGALNTVLELGYKEKRDLPLLTKLMVNCLDQVRARRMRSFIRPEHALTELVTAIRTGQHFVSPIWPRPAPPPGPQPAEPTPPPEGQPAASNP